MHSNEELSGTLDYFNVKTTIGDSANKKKTATFANCLWISPNIKGF